MAATRADFTNRGAFAKGSGTETAVWLGASGDLDSADRNLAAARIALRIEPHLLTFL
jgi:hypothetical protein